MASSVKKTPDVVEVEWIDSQGWMGWHSHESTMSEHGDEPDKLCRTAGYIVTDDKAGITISLSRTVPTTKDGVNPRSWGDTIWIPSVAIRSKTVLRSR